MEEDVVLVETGPLDRDDFWDHCHNTVSGNRKIAERITREIRNRREGHEARVVVR